MAEVVKSTVVDDADQHIVGDVLPEYVKENEVVNETEDYGRGGRVAQGVIGLNWKGLWADEHNMSLRHAAMQDRFDQLFSEMVADNHNIVNGLAQGYAHQQVRAAGNGADFDQLMRAAMLAQGIQSAAVGAQVTDALKNVAKTALDNSQALAAQGNPQVQGSTGVAQATGQGTLAAAMGQAELNATTLAGESMSALIQTNRALADELAAIVAGNTSVQTAILTAMAEVTTVAANLAQITSQLAGLNIPKVATAPAA